jgi:glycine cleavage system aminomethyltransferase T/glycine/D-amino acid oxidase-like deaminating enzyme
MANAHPPSTSETSLPTHAQVVIIGGGVIGCSLAYHLTKLGWRDVIILERKQLTSGTTWHAAGLVVCGGFATETLLYMARYTRELYKNLEAETGVSTGFKPVGYVEIASSASRLRALRKNAEFARAYGVNVEEISPAEFKQLWPLADLSGVLAGLYTPEDGRANPVDVTMSLAKGARNGGARIYEDTLVTAIERKNGCVTGVVTDRGEVQAEYVANCAGMWGRKVGAMAGVDVPLQATEHYYLITEPIQGVSPDLPILEDVDRYAYYREEVGGLMLGLFEPVAAPWGMGGIPQDFAFGEIQPDWERMMPYLETAMERIPALKTAGVRKLFCGPESFTPDMTLLMGEAPELKNFFVAAGLNSLGILLGGGVGQVLAHWIVDGLPPLDVNEVNIDRMLPFQNTPRYVQDRAVEILGFMYKETFPNTQFETARGARQSIFHERLRRAGAFFGSSAGWEYPDWFAPQGVEPRVEQYSWGRQNWFEYNAAEHHACRENVILMDLSLMSKFLVKGRDAEAILNRISVSDVSIPVGKIVYTEWLNSRGFIEADLTVTRLAEDAYMVICSDLAHRHVETWLKRHVPPEAHCFVTDVTSAYAMLNLQGPNSRQLLARLTHTDVSNPAFPYMTMQEIDLHYAKVLAFRITYLGELGYELYIPTEFGPQVFDVLVEAGQELGLKHAGLQALNTLRIEKAYRDYGHDIDATDTPLEAGLSFVVDFDKPGGFIGREALLRQKEAGPLKQRFVQFQLQDPEPLLNYGEQIYRDGKRVGYVRSGAYGFTLGGAVGLAMVENEAGVTPEYIRSGRFEIEVDGVRYPTLASLRPMYDPHNLRVKA